MEEKRKSPLGAMIVPGLVVFVIGALFGLYIGWFAWPVTWKDATPAILDANSRQLFLRAAIDSYMVNQDAGLAKERYDSLGEYSGSTLSAIYSNPLNQTPQAVQAFATAVKAEAVLQSPPGMPPTTQVATQPASSGATPVPGTAVTTPAGAAARPAGGGLLGGLLLPGFLACLALLVGLGLVLFIFSRSRKRTRSARAPEQFVRPAADETLSGATAVDTLTPADELERSTARLDETPAEEAAAPGELPDWLQEAASSQPEPAAQASGAAAFAAPTAEEEMPDWLQETAPQRPVEEPPATEAEIPDWLQEKAPAAASSADLPDWLAGAVPATWEPHETSEQTHAKFSQDLAQLPAMEPEFAQRLHSAGVSVPLILLKKGATPESRQKLAEKAGIDADELNTWVNVVDLFRVRGLNTEHALLLEGVNIHGVSDLAAADAAKLTQDLNTANQEYNLLTEAPGLAEVTYWIEQAQLLPRAVSQG